MKTKVYSLNVVYYSHFNENDANFDTAQKQFTLRTTQHITGNRRNKIVTLKCSTEK